LASLREREEHRLAGRLVASIDPMNAKGTPYAIVALIHIEGFECRLRLVEPDRPNLIPIEALERLQSAIAESWKTARSVDLVDELGRPLLLGALNSHPDGETRCLTYNSHDGRSC
jgi:hypothetical protein